MPQRLKEGVLDQVLRLRPVAREGVRVAVHRVEVLEDIRLKSGAWAVCGMGHLAV